MFVLHGDGRVAGDGHVGVRRGVVADAAGAALSSNADGLGGYRSNRGSFLPSFFFFCFTGN